MRNMKKIWAMAMTVVMLFTSMNIDTIQANTNQTAKAVASQWKVKDNSLNKVSGGEVMHFTSEVTPTLMSSGGLGTANNGVINLDFSVLCIYEDEDKVSHTIDLVFDNQNVYLYRVATLSYNSTKGKYEYTAEGVYEEFEAGKYTPYTAGFDILYGDTLANDDVVEFAGHLQDFTEENNVYRTRQITTDEYGQGQFTGLTNGIYLVMFDDQEVEFEINGKTIGVSCESQPILIGTPGFVSDSQAVPAIMIADGLIEYADFMENGIYI